MIVKPSVSFLTADSDSDLVTDTTTVTTSMDGNASYPLPAPPLAQVETAKGELVTAIANAADGGKTLTSIKDDKRAALVALLRLLANYVAAACLGDMTKLLSSGFPVQKPDRTPATVPVTPPAPKLTQGKTGEMSATGKPSDQAYIYNWRVALASAPLVYVQHGQSTGARADFTDLTAGGTYLVQFNAVGTAGTSDWSNASSLMVV